jgi:hypothetical protein
VSEQVTGGWGTPSWQGGEVGPGDVFTSDKSPTMARELLQAVAELGLDPIVVRTTTAGFIVPTEVWEHAEDTRTEHAGIGPL